MNNPDAAWEARVADLWQALDTYAPEDFVARLDLLVGELPPDDAIGAFRTRFGARLDRQLRLAVPTVRAALEAGFERPAPPQSRDQMAVRCAIWATPGRRPNS